MVGDNDFTDWWNEQTGEPSGPLTTTENPDGQPEREGEGHPRYRVGERFLHLGFGETDLLAGITLMVTTP